LTMYSANTMNFAIATQKRRTIRALQPISPLPDCNIIDLASNALLYVPSAFNSQSTRLTIHFSESHRKLWSITGAALETNLGAERYNSGAADRITAYGKGYGTILFWDDMEVIEQMSKVRQTFIKIRRTSGCITVMVCISITCGLRLRRTDSVLICSITIR